MIDSRTSYLQDLGRRLASGWSPGHETAVGDLAHAFTRAFHTDTAVVQIGVNEAVLRFSLEDIRLRNFDNVYAVAVGGDVPDRELLNSLKSRFKGDDRVLLILAPTLAWQKDLDSVFPGRLGFMAACLPDFVSLLSEQDSKEQLKRFALDRVSRYALNPFNVLKVPAQNMFYGRSHQIEMLLQTPDTSWAIAGPARVGKSTVLQHYHKLVRRIDPVRAQNLAYTDFYYLDDYAESTISSKIAFALNPTRQAQKVDLSSLRTFLMREKNARPGGRLELLFDEVDMVCGSESFKKLAECAKDGICRLILCGKMNLFESLHDPGHQLHGRLSALKLEPFRLHDAQRLFLDPLHDLGFRLIAESAIAEEVLRETSGYPHLIQYIGTELVRKAVESGIDTIDLAFFEKVRDDYETAQFFMAPIQKVEDEPSELIALSMLQSQADKFTEADIRRIAAREGLQLDEKRVSAICRKLYVSNVLSWQGDYFKISTGGLSRYARKLGYFVPRLLELRRKIGRGNK